MRGKHWAKRLERDGNEHMPLLDRNSSTPYYQQVYEQIARAIENGFFPVGKKLPSIRECARNLGCSNTTVELAYQRLVAEGYVQSRRGSGYTVCELAEKPAGQFGIFTDEYLHALSKLKEHERQRGHEATIAYDFAYDSVDASLFPFTNWARICREVYFSEGSGDACLYNSRQGLQALREQIALYLGSELGLHCIAEQVLIMPTTRDLVSEVMALFSPTENIVAMGNPGYDEVGRRLRERGYRVQSIPLFPYPTWEQAQEAIAGANVVFATPASQFPTNRSMPLDMRKELVNWAQRNNAYVIDDEYSWEFQRGAGRLPALATLDDAGRIITMGTFSNTFTPAVCLSYAVLPPQLMLKWKELRPAAHPQVPWQTQAAMTAFMKEDLWRTHLRKMRTAMQNKHQRLVEAFGRSFGDAVEIVSGTSSLYVLVQTHDGRDERELIDAAAQAGVRIYPTSQYWNGNPPAEWRYVLVGYSSIPIDAIEEGVAKLAAAWALE